VGFGKRGTGDSTAISALRLRPRRAGYELQGLGTTGGWACDTRDGRVEVLVEGEAEEVRQMIRWCYSDRSGAEVHGTSVYQEAPSRDLTAFVVR
jgi:hypothetical protein